MNAKPYLRAIIAASIFYGPVVIIAESSTQTLSEPTEINGVPCQVEVETNANDVITSCTLSRDYAISGNVLPRGTRVLFSDTGALTRCKLGRETVLSGVDLPSNSWVTFDVQGHMQTCGLAADTVIQGHLCKAGADVYCPWFFPDGKLSLAWLAKDEEIDGVPCAKVSIGKEFLVALRVVHWEPVTMFYHDGRLRHAMLSHDATIQGHVFKKGDVVDFSPDGKLELQTQSM